MKLITKLSTFLCLLPISLPAISVTIATTCQAPLRDSITTNNGCYETSPTVYGFTATALASASLSLNLAANPADYSVFSM